MISVGAILVIVAPYMPWLHVVILGGFNLTALLSAAHSFVGLAYIISGLGLSVLLVALLARSADVVRGLAVSVGSILLLAGGYVVYGLVRAVSDSAGLGQLEVGPIVGVIGSVLMTVPPIIAYAQQPKKVNFVKRRLSQDPRWLPAIGAVAIGSAIAWIPYHAGVANYCGTAVGAVQKRPTRLPSASPPAAVATVLQHDQSDVSAAQGAVAQQQQGDATVTQEENAANSLNDRANQAANAVTSLESTVTQDEGTVEGDQGTVQGDQSSVQADANTVVLDQSTLQQDQQLLASDQQAGYDTSADEQAIASANQTIANDQATLAKDQQTLQNDQATLDQDQATLAAVQNQLSDAQLAAASLAQQAGQAEAKAQQAIAQQQQEDSAAELTLTNAQNQLQYDQNQWNESYETTLASVRSHNARLTSCQTQARDHFTAAGIVAILGGTLTGLLWWRRRPKTDSELPSPAAG